VKLQLTAVGTAAAPSWRLDLDCGPHLVSELQLATGAPGGSEGWIDSLNFGGGCGPAPVSGGGGCSPDPINLGETVDPDASGAFLTDENGIQQTLTLRPNTLYVELKGIDNGNGPQLCPNGAGGTFLGFVSSAAAGVGEASPNLFLSVNHALGTTPVVGLSPGDGGATEAISDFEVLTSDPAGSNRPSSGQGGL
jgi:hypothetical protein